MLFKKLELEDIDKLAPFFASGNSSIPNTGSMPRACDYSIGGIFMWRDYYHMKFCIEDGILFTTMEENGETLFCMPIGAHINDAVSRIACCCNTNSHPCAFSLVPEEYLGTVLSRYPRARVTEQSANFDYLYLASDLADFPGKRFSGQRNHFNRFKREHKEWSFERITPETIPELKAYFASFFERHNKASESSDEEYVKIVEVLDNLAAYNMFGGVLRAEGDILGFSLGERVNDTIHVHIEKAERDVPGAYQTVVCSFAKLFAAEGVVYLNREDDMGDEGLRTSKLSYHPVTILKKYRIDV